MKQLRFKKRRLREAKNVHAGHAAELGDQVDELVLRAAASVAVQQKWLQCAQRANCRQVELERMTKGKEQEENRKIADSHLI